MRLLLLLIVTGVAVDGCDEKSEYKCANDKCIPINLFNNSINDCGDNSDESTMPCAKPMFSCSNLRCVLIDWVLDGRNDCLDGSDEAKLIGTRCDMVTDCCQCDFYIENSECIQDECRCIRGYYSNPMRNRCLRRLIYAGCQETSDCSDAIKNTSCQKNICLCNDGYYPHPDNRTCIKRELDEECTTDLECNAIDNSYCFNSSCQCRTGYHKQSNECHLNQIYYPCTFNSTCIIQNSLCENDQCLCATGYYPTSFRDQCKKRKIGDRCITSLDCSLVIDNSKCRDGYCECMAKFAISSDRTQCNSYLRSIDYFLVTLGVSAVGALIILDAFLVLWLLFNFVLK